MFVGKSGHCVALFTVQRLSRARANGMAGARAFSWPLVVAGKRQPVRSAEARPGEQKAASCFRGQACQKESGYREM